VIHPEKGHYFNRLLLSLAWVPALGLYVSIFSPIAGFCFFHNGWPRYFTPLCKCTLRTWQDSMGQVRQLAIANGIVKQSKRRSNFIGQK